MSKGLKKLESIKESFKFNVDKLVYNANKSDFTIIEKELKDGEENKKMLNIFKNALTIEHYEIAELDHSQDANDYFVRTLFNIKQNQIDNAIRKALREWVLKNAFPKELKALEIIKNKLPPLMRSALLDYCNKEEYDLLKEVLL